MWRPYVPHFTRCCFHFMPLSFLGHDVGKCPLYKDHGKDASAGRHVVELPEGVWRDGGARKAELPGRDVGAPLAGKDTDALPTAGRFTSYLMCAGVKAPVDMMLMFSRCAIPAGAGL